MEEHQAEILKQLTMLVARVVECRSEITLLRTELGLDSLHGRLPTAESTLLQHAAHLEKIDEALFALQTGESENRGREKFINTIFSLIGGGAGGAAIEIIAKLVK